MPRLVVLGLACAIAHAGLACDLPPDQVVPTLDAGVADAGAADDSYAFVVLPDTQFYSSDWPDIFASRKIMDEPASPCRCSVPTC